MQKILSLTRKCIQEYDMIAPHDRIAVGVSGGKDSLLLLAALAELRRFYPIPYHLEAITVDMGLGADYTEIREFAHRLGVPYTVVPSELYQIIFEERKETNPCSLCAKMRRGMLHDAALERGCNKAALGHHWDDAVETFMMSQVFEGRISCFFPVTYLDRSGLTQIRPLLYVSEALIRGVARRLNFPILESKCPADGTTKREEIKELLREMNERYPGYRERIFGAMQRLPLPGWERKNTLD